MATRPIAELIDDLLAAPKTIAGLPDWAEAPYQGEERLLMPLQINSVSCGAELIITAYPYLGHSKFRIMICAPKCVWRIDYANNEAHINSFNRPPDLGEYNFCDPYYHSWADNRRFCTQGTLPDKLYNARIMPADVRSFDTASRWFCGETNIEQPSPGWIALPPRRRLI
jgi:hypothetical protein